MTRRIAWASDPALPVDAVAAALAPRLGQDIARERANNICCAWALSDECYTYHDARTQIAVVHGYGVMLRRDELHELAMAVLDALEPMGCGGVEMMGLDPEVCP